MSKVGMAKEITKINKKNFTYLSMGVASNQEYFPRKGN